MSNEKSAKVAVGTMLPYGECENGKLFLKLDGINDGLYVFMDGHWLMIGKITTSEPVRFAVSTVVSPKIKATTPPAMTFGGNF